MKIVGPSWSGVFRSSRNWIWTRSFAKQKWIGVAEKGNLCSHVSLSERKSEVQRSDAATSAGLHFDVSERAYTAMADYRLPQVLMNEGVITITAAAQGKLSQQLLDMEIEGDIRAATIVACEELARQSGYPEVAVDRALWHASQAVIAAGGMRVPAMRVATRKY